ncbi:MAG TPA: replicative DNA helicase [Verrucomicrobiales bacterium]|nr:replicative DNA helicase [Verrucomicrobiales bacterium]
MSKDPSSSAPETSRGQPKKNKPAQRRDDPAPAILMPSGQADDAPPELLRPAPRAAGRDQILRALPSSIDAEKAVLGCLLRSPNDPEVISAVVEALAGSDAFHVPAHRLLYETLLELSGRPDPFDLVALTQILADRKRLEEAGGHGYLASLITHGTVPSLLGSYLELVTKKSTLRSIIAACSESVQEAYENQEEVDGVLDRTEERILAIRDRRGGRDIPAMFEQVRRAVDYIEVMLRNRGRITGLSSGFTGLDEVTSGFQAGQMIVIAARPSMGKTSLALNIVEHVALHERRPVAVFSLEMPSIQLVLRVLCSQANLSLSELQRGFLREGDFPAIMHAAGTLSEAGLFIDDSPALSITEVRSKARRLKKRHNIELVVIDYLQLMRSTSRRAQESRQIEMSEISASVKALAKELDLPVVVLAQLNRGPENRGGKPKLSDLRESGAIEQDADVVGLLFREKYYAEDEAQEERAAGRALLDVAKNRNGPTGKVKLTFLDQQMRFVDRIDDDDEEES